MLPISLLLLGLLAPAPDLFRPLDVEAAVSAARTEHKSVLVVFRRTGTSDTKKLDTTTWTDARVREWIGLKAVAIQLDVSKEDEVATALRVHSSPTLVFLNETGSEIDRITGYVDPRAFLAETKLIFGGADPMERAQKRLAADPDDPHRRIDVALLLGDRGYFAPALSELLWCWDHGIERDPEFAVTRNAFLVGEIVRLGRVHPKATDALAGRANGLLDRVTSCTVTEAELADFLLLNRELQQVERTLKAFDSLSSSTEACAALRSRLGPLVIDPLIDSRRYAEALALLGDPRAHFNRLVADFRAKAQRVERERPDAAPTVIDIEKRAVRGEATRVFEALLGAGEFDAADSFAAMVVSFDGRGATHSALICAALKVDAHGQAKTLVGRALADPKLTPSEKEDVQRLARAIIQPK